MSKTVKRVSKTAKRVMTVMMVGLVATLGAKAEAHGYLFAGKWKFCSVCGVGKLTDPPLSAEVEFVVTIPPKKAEILCPDGTEVKSTDEVKLVVQKTLVKADITNVNAKVGDITTAQVEGIVSDTHYLDPALGYCGVDKEGAPVTPDAVLIRKMFGEINVFCSDPTDKLCSSTIKPHSTWKGNCKLPVTFDFSNAPPFGTFYKCSEISICHEQVCLSP